MYGENGRNKLGYTLRLLGPARYEGKTSGSVVTQRSLLSSDGRAKNGSTRKARHARGADLVALVMTGSTNDYCGSGSFYVNGNSARAFSVSRFGGEGKYSFSHEIGHNLGADHDQMTRTQARIGAISGSRAKPHGRSRSWPTLAAVPIAEDSPTSLIRTFKSPRRPETRSWHCL